MRNNSPGVGSGRRADTRLDVIGGWMCTLVPEYPLFSFRAERLLLSPTDLQLQISSWSFPGGLFYFSQRRCHSGHNPVLSGDVLWQSGKMAVKAGEGRSGTREGACVSWGWREIRQGHWGRQGIMLKLDVMFCIFSMVCWTVSPSSFERSCWEVTCSEDLFHKFFLLSIF